MSVVLCTKICIKEIFKDMRFPNGKFYEDVFIARYIIDKARRIAFMEVFFIFLRLFYIINIVRKIEYEIFYGRLSNIILEKVISKEGYKKV